MNNQKCYISPNLEAQFNDSFYRVKNDSNGHPRYVTHYLAFLNDSELGIGDYDIAKQRANKLGFRFTAVKTSAVVLLLPVTT